MSIISYTEKQGSSSAVDDGLCEREAMLEGARGLLRAWLWKGIRRSTQLAWNCGKALTSASGASSWGVKAKETQKIKVMQDRKWKIQDFLPCPWVKTISFYCSR